MNIFISNKRFIRILIFGIVYLLTGILTAVISNPLKDIVWQNVWRIGSFLISIFVFVVHIRIENMRYGNSPRLTAINTSSAVAASTFVIAVLANINEWLSSSTNNIFLLLALVIWPIVTGGLTFIVSYFITFLMNKIRLKS